MIRYFPNFYPDELVYSLFARYHAKTGSLAYVYTAEEIYKWKHTKPDIEFINQLTDEAYELITKEIPMKTIIEKHTMFPYYARFISAERKREALDSLVSMEGNLKSILNLECSKNSCGLFLRYCPKCVSEDRETYGETYWHRSHQIRGIRICAKHGCHLKNSNVLMTKKDKPQLITAESMAADNDKTNACENKIELRLVSYITEVFQSDMDMDCDVVYGEYLNQCLPLKYISESGIQRHLELLYEDYRAYYNGLLEESVMPLYRLQKLFNGKIYRCYDICQLAMFEGISVKELVKPSPAASIKQINHIYEKIASEKNLKYDMVQMIGDAVLYEYRRENRVQRKCGAVSLKWEQMDRELLPNIKDICQKIYTGNNKRPHKVTLMAVQKEMKLPDKRLDKLPMCKAEILRYKESQKEYWAREVVWAYEKIISDGQAVCWTRIRQLTNMRSVDFKACKKYVSHYANEVTTAAILNLV